MENNHVDGLPKKNENTNSIFTLFTNLTNDNGKNGKHCLSLIKSLQGEDFSVGTGSNTQYSIKRLVKGLCSTRFNTQCACFAALTCVLKFHSINVEELLSIVDKELEGATKSEEGFTHAGCVLTCGAIVHSGVFSSQPEKIQQNILNKIVKSGKAKSYITLLSYQFLLDLVDLSDFKSNLWPSFKNELAEINNVDSLYFLLGCYKKKPKIVSKFIDKNFTSIQAVVKKCFKLLLETNVSQDHPLYNLVSQLVVDDSNLFELYQKILNESSNVKDSALIIFLLGAFKNLKDTALIPKLLTSKVIETFLRVLTYNHKRKAEDAITSNGKAVLDMIVELLKNENVDDQIRLDTIEKFLFYPANLKFEKKTGSKCVHLLTLQLKKKGVKELAKTYQKILSGELKKKIDAKGNSEDWNSKDKLQVLFNHVKLINHPSVKTESNWKLSQIKFIYNIAFLKSINCSSEVQKIARDCFYKAVELQMSKLDDLIQLLDELLIYVNENLPNVKNFNEEVWQKMFSTVQKLKKKSNKKLYIAIHVLLIYMGFQLFINSNLAESTIEELLSCYAHLKKIHKETEGETDEPHWTEVTVDLILSLLSRENKLWRHVVSCVFPQIVEYMTPSALHQILDSLDRERKILSHPDSDQSESEEDGDDDDENSEDEDTESSLTEDDDGEEKVNDQLRVAVRNALGNSAAAASDVESVDMDQMDEEEARRLNDNLSAAFKLFKSNSNEKKKKQTKEDEALMHFRIRVLDLLEIYITSNQSMAGCLDLIIPCFELYEFAIQDVLQRPLQNRMESILKKIPSCKKFASTEGVTGETIVNVFKALMERKEASSLMFVEMIPRIAEICAFLVRCSQSIPSEKSKILLTDEYDLLLKTFFQGKDNRLPISIFESILRIQWIGNWKIVKTLFEVLSDPNIRIFKKMQAIQMLIIFYRNDKLHQAAEEETVSEFIKLEADFANQFFNFLKKSEKLKTKPTENMSAAFFINLLKLIKIAFHAQKKYRGSSKISPWSNLIAEMAKIDVVMNNGKCKGMINGLGELLGVAVPKVEKRKRTVSNSSAKSDASVDGTAKKEKRKRTVSNSSVKSDASAGGKATGAKENRKRTVSNSSVKSDASTEGKAEGSMMNGIKKKKKLSPDKINSKKEIKNSPETKKMQVFNVGVLSAIAETLSLDKEEALVKKSKKMKFK